MSRRSPIRAALVAAIALGLCRPGPAAGADGRTGGPRHTAPIFRPEQVGAPPGARLLYFGGRVLSNVEVVMVLWGDGPFAPYVTGEASPSLSQLLSAVAGSAYVAGLAEYDTTREAQGGGPGTSQHIGPGRFAGVVRIAPSLAGDALDDAAIAAELAAQLARGSLPAPRDAGGNLETLYLVYFPAGKRITLGTEESCRSFCAYHGTFEWRGRTVPYAVMPDLAQGSGCDLACGVGATPFENAAEIVSHELAEAITDPDVGSAVGAGPSLAWYDPMNGENADLCVGEAGSVAGTDGARWPVQKVWSNARAACVVPSAPEPAPVVASSRPPAPAPAGSGRAGALVVRPATAMGIHPTLVAPVPRTPSQAPRTLPSEPSPLPLGKASRVEIGEENDAFGARRPATDEFYTQGLRISGRWAVHPELAEDITQMGFAVGQNIYTPSNIHTTDLSVLRKDRPYAGWLYASLLLRMEGASRSSLRLGADAEGRGWHETEFEVALGVTGQWSGAADVQTRFHALLHQWSGLPALTRPDPAGWSVYQIETQPTFDMSLRHQLDLVQASARLGAFTAGTGSVLGARLSPRMRMDVGSTFDAASLGLEVRAGLLGASRLRERPWFPFELYGFVRADGRYVVWNAFIEAPLQNGVVPLVALQPWVADLDVGAILRLGPVELGWGQLWRTSEIRPNPPGARAVHDVGQLTVAWVSP
jgi:hypothetical protein